MRKIYFYISTLFMLLTGLVSSAQKIDSARISLHNFISTPDVRALGGLANTVQALCPNGIVNVSGLGQDGTPPYTYALALATAPPPPTIQLYHGL